MRLLFTICGRAGSTGCPHKNERMFLNIPLAYYSLAVILLYQQAHTEDSIDIVLSTDSERLMALIEKQKQLSIDVLIRDPKLADGKIPKIAVIKDAWQYSQNVNQGDYDFVVDLDITSPLRCLSNLEQALDKMYKQPVHDVVFSVTKSRRSPYYNMVKSYHDSVVLVQGDAKFFARQEIPDTFDMNASIYVYRPSFLENNQSNYIFDGNCGMIPMIDTGVLDIDDDLDFGLMESIADYMFVHFPEFAKVQNIAKKLWN